MWVLALLLTQAPAVDRYTLWGSAAALPSGPPAIVAIAPMFPTDLTTGPQGEAIILDVEVRPDGLVTRALLVDGNEAAARDSAMKAIRSWRFQPSGGEQSSRTVRVVFVYRTMPAGTPPEGLTTIFRGKYEIEVRRLQTGAEPQNNQMQLTRPATARRRGPRS